MEKILEAIEGKHRRMAPDSAAEKLEDVRKARR